MSVQVLADDEHPTSRCLYVAFRQPLPRCERLAWCLRLDAGISPSVAYVEIETGGPPPRLHRHVPVRAVLLQEFFHTLLDFVFGRAHDAFTPGGSTSPLRLRCFAWSMRFAASSICFCR